MKKTPLPKDLMHAYETVKNILSKHSNKFYEDRVPIRKEIERQLGSRMDYWWAVSGYLSHAKWNFDPQVKNAFWDVFHDYLSGVHEIDAAYDGLMIEGLYDMVTIDLCSAALDKDGHLRDSSGESEEIAFEWVKSIISHARNESKPVLIIGDTGTSKEIIAAVIHKLSSRGKNRGGRYITVNCAAIPDTLLESELFGHEKDAFTDAKSAKPGLFEEADKGTLFLDEIGRISTAMQAKILRVIEERTIRRIGSTKTKDINVRLIAAVQPKDLESDWFLPDLKYRLGFPYVIKMPSLKERLAKYPHIFNWAQMLIDYVLMSVLNDMGKRDERGKIEKFKISDAVYKLLLSYNYEGNYRELRNILMAAVDSASWDKRETLLPEDFALSLDGNTTQDDTAKHEDIKLKDIFSHADKIRASIVAAKIQGVIDRGEDVKTVLSNEYAQEGQTLTNSQYTQYTRKIKTVTKKKISEFKKP